MIISGYYYLMSVCKTVQAFINDRLANSALT